MEKKEDISRWVRGYVSPPKKILKVETKICAIWAILETYLKKCSTLKFITNISFVPPICIHRSIILIFIEKSMLVNFFSWKKYFSMIFYFHFHENPHFCSEFQALPLKLCNKPLYQQKLAQQPQSGFRKTCRRFVTAIPQTFHLAKGTKKQVNKNQKSYINEKGNTLVQNQHSWGGCSTCPLPLADWNKEVTQQPFQSWSYS